MDKLKIKFHPLFWIFIIILLFSNNFLSLFSYVLCVFLHELGHSFVARLLGYRLNKITFLPFGASLSGKENVFYSVRHEVLVSVAGPAVNLILLLTCLSFFWLLPVTYSILENFYFANLITFLFNFFPVYPLDGGRVLYALLKTKFSNQRSYKITKIVGMIFSIFLFFLFILSAFYSINFTLGLTSIFLISGLFFEDKSSYYLANFSFLNKTKKLKQGMETNVLSIGENTTLYSVLRKLNKFKYNVVNIVSKSGKILSTICEDELIKMFVENPLNQNVSECRKF